jgi:hypothetical protein
VDREISRRGRFALGQDAVKNRPPVTIPNPCPKLWRELDGDSKRRFCNHCQHSVHNLSEMSHVDRNKLLSESSGRLCVAYETDRHGDFVSRDRENRIRGFLRSSRSGLFSLLAILLPFAFASCATRQTLGKPCPSADAKAVVSSEEDGNKAFVVGRLVERPLWKRILWPWE